MEAKRLIVGPFNRVEGDLEVQLEVADDRVTAAYVNSPLFRGFERILEGRDPMDALVIAPRICGICSVSQSHAAARALAAAAGVSAPPNGVLATDLMLAAENVGDHLTHFNVFFMPDFARPAYAARPWFQAAEARFKAGRGTALRQAVEARAGLFHLFGILAGKWPHTLTIQPGGVARALDARDKVRILALIGAFRRYLETTLYAASLEQVASLGSRAELAAFRAAGRGGDFRLFLDIVEDLGLDRLGRAYDRFLSYGAYGGETPLYRPGTLAGGMLAGFSPDEIAEDHTNARMTGRSHRHHPFEGSTLPDPSDEVGYTWCKAPRLSGLAYECGALARQAVDGQGLARDLALTTGGTVASRVIGRLVETARTVIAMETWARAIDPAGDWYYRAPLPDQARAFGLTEAARGALGHWLTIEDGRIAAYQIIAPTTWNFSPRDSDGMPGPLEAALVGTPVEAGERVPLAVQHVVRSFDPCMVCTVH